MCVSDHNNQFAVTSSHFLAILPEFRDGMTVDIGGQESDPFDVLASVKQRSVLAQVIFDLFLVVTLLFGNGLSMNDDIQGFLVRSCAQIVQL